MKQGDVIRVSDHPGTKGKRFVVSEIRDDVVFARDDGRLRAFSKDDCHVDRKRTRAKRE